MNSTHPKLFVFNHNGNWCSPKVGRFFPELHQNDASLLGTLVQLGQQWELHIPPGFPKPELPIQSPQDVEYGTPLAHNLPAAPTTVDLPKGAVESPAYHYIYAPCPGHLHTDHNGLPYVQPGQTIHPGDIVAVIEMMKLGVDVIYDGNTTAQFHAYVAHGTVQAGDIVCEIITNLSQPHPQKGNV